MRVASISAALLLPLALALGGCVEVSDVDADAADALGIEADPVDEAASAIVGGAVDDGHRAVVALTFQGQAFCSGTLIAPTVVITAAHCLHQAHVDPRAIAGVRVFFGTDVAGAGTTIDVTEIRLHPAFVPDDPEQDDDVALIRLAVEAPVEPLAMGGAPDQGKRLTLVGFGRPDSEVAETGVKRVGQSLIDQRTDRLFLLRPEPHDTCTGDSGGAAIAKIRGAEVLVGIHTRSDCTSGMIDERVDAHHESFILPFLGASTCIDCHQGEGGGAPEGTGGGAGDEDEVDTTEDEATEAGATGMACSVGGAAGSSSGGAAGAGLLAAMAAFARRQLRSRRPLRSRGRARSDG